MLEWNVLEWLQAGQTPLLILMAYFLWKVERRVYTMEVKFEHALEGGSSDD